MIIISLSVLLIVSIILYVRKFNEHKKLEKEHEYLELAYDELSDYKAIVKDDNVFFTNTTLIKVTTSNVMINPDKYNTLMFLNLLNRLCSVDGKIVNISIRSRKLNDLEIHYMLEKNDINNMFKLPDRDYFVSRDEAKEWINDNLLTYEAEVSHIKEVNNNGR